MAASRLDKAATSRLSARGKGAAGAAPAALGLKAKPARDVKRNKGFRLDSRAILRLETLLERVCETTGRRVSESAVVAGVLLLGARVDVEELVAAVKEAAWE